jgi:hypothetical protein
MTSEGAAGLIPPATDLSGLTEIRVHGVGGTPPESLLGDLAPTRVAGDRVAGFYRTTDAAGRHREAYSWGGLTSRSPTRALWALLLPAMFANMAGWMSRPVPGDRVEAEREPTTPAFRWCARLSALGLTLAAAATVTYLLVDVVAYQCGGVEACRGSGWTTRAVDALPAPARPGPRIAAAAAVALVVVLLLVLLANRTRSRYEQVEPPTAVPLADPGTGAQAGARAGADVVRTVVLTPAERCAAAQTGGLRSARFWSGSRWHLFLTRVHVAATLAVVAVLVGIDAGAWGVVAVVLAALCLVGAAAALRWDDARVLPATVLVVVAAVAFAVATGAAAAGGGTGAGGPAAPRAPGGAGGPLPGAAGALGLLWVVGLALLVPLAVQQIAVRSRRPASEPPDVEAPAVFPWAAPFVMTTAGLVVAAAVLLSGLGYAAEELTTERTEIVLPGWVRVAAGTLSLGLLAVLLVFAVGMLVAALRARRVDAAEVREDLRRRYPAPDDGLPVDAAWWRSALDPPMSGATRSELDGAPTRWVRSVAMMRLLARRSTTVAWLLIGVAALGAVLAATTILTQAVGFDEDGGLQAAAASGMRAAVLIPPTYVGVLLLAWRNDRWRRVLGTLFDVGSFFPRSFHPFAPPSYAERAVPELTRRVWRLHDNGGRVVLTAHSQGSVLAAAVLARELPGRPAEPTVGLVSVGSPLGKLYRWAFPALFSDELLRTMAGGAPGFGPVRWENVSYATDYIGGPVAHPGWGPDVGVDVGLVDPPSPRYVADQPLPRVLSHTGYWVDPAFWARVDAMCASVRATTDTTDATAEVPVPVLDSPAPDPLLPLRYR